MLDRMRGIAVTALTIVLLSTQAEAALPPPMAAAPYPAEKTALEVERIEVTIDCRQSGRFGLACQLISDYAIGNPTDAAIRVALKTGGLPAANLQLDGAPLPAENGALMLSVDPGATRHLVARESIELQPRRMNMFFAFEPTYIRHLYFGGFSSAGYIPSIELPRSFGRFWGRVGEAVYTARYPAGWSELHGSWKHADEGGRRVATNTSSGAAVYFGPRPPEQGPRLVNGGPYIELGGTFDVGFRGRLGYEVGYRGWMIGSLSVGSDFDEDLIVTPLVEAASPSVIFIPSFGVGLGAPIRVRPDLSAGIRIQLVATWPVGFVTTFDYWPEDDDWLTTLSARIGI
jgi:hypothetical protein